MPDAGKRSDRLAAGQTAHRSRVRLIDADELGPGDELPPLDAYADEDRATSGRIHAPAAIPLLRSALAVAETLPQSEWVLRPYLERNAMAILFGDFGTYKSFIALDWSLRVAIGLPAIGSEYFREGAPVIFISAEGRGLGKRLRAWCLHEYSEKHWHDVLRNVPLHIIEAPVNLSEAANAKALAEAVAALGITPSLVVVDTLSRNSNGEVESSTGDASAYLANLDQYLRARFRCAVLLVHHVGHLDKGRIRGPIVLAANTDCMIRAERAGPHELSVNLRVERTKDAELPPPASLRAKVIDLGEFDDDGRSITSLALEDNGEPVLAKHEPAGKHAPALLAGLREWQRSHPEQPYIHHDDINALCKAQAIPRQRKATAIASLQDAGHLVPAVGGFRFEA